MEDIDAFHSVLAPVWHARPGPERLQDEVPPVFRLPKGGFHATSFSCCCSSSQFSKN
jgi:hypothetical protein